MRFVTVLYFMITTLTTVGYGDYSATNAYEAVFLMVVLIGGVAFFSVLMGNVTSAISEYNWMVEKEDMAGSANVWLDMMESVHGRLPLKLK
mmetsp:Transcript_24061/g.4017  ORF Transcript_24061/g.4017 Transcript_24061/m.4017 type:complete len:91 (-) Transcript_24061:894-1166(-)|eukprot:CAMPEP_0168316526 /NCGR_PEP_ID=MMETSP0210-20121227/16185_1 /TAXON_ID=40633 /ORGANISM="Condylostoma magnum, Strain COL2" /LENGTH=90 /DNA_ID=CAMNT_0008298483 /DNA_START=832 /DNA_END=1104 /DNA_ORIENTATION=+